jgi:hypothetical protein
VIPLNNSMPTICSGMNGHLIRCNKTNHAIVCKRIWSIYFCRSSTVGNYYLYFNEPADTLFTENETNHKNYTEYLILILM